jgi:hypothetical protein
MFVAYFLVGSIILVCVGFAVQIMNGVKELDKNSVDQ